MELKCQLVIRMACNSGFAFTDRKGTLTKIAFSSSSAGLRLTGSSSRKGADLCSACCCLTWRALPPLPFAKRARRGGRVVGTGACPEGSKPLRPQNWKSKIAPEDLPALLFRSLPEILKEVLTVIRVPDNAWSLAFLGRAM